MTDWTIPDDLAEQISHIAQDENRTVVEVLEKMVKQYKTAPNREDAAHQLRAKFYERARRYWQTVGDQERLALTDEQLDEQFWLFDKDDIPRLKSDEGEFELLPNPLTGLISTLDAETDAAELSTSVRETLAQYTHPEYGWTKRGRTD